MPKKKSEGKKRDQKKQTQYYQRLKLKEKLWKAKNYEEHVKIQAQINSLKHASTG